MKDTATKQGLAKELRKLRTRVTALEKSKRHQAQIEKALREAEQFNQEVIATAGEGIVVYDRAFRYLVWNKFMENLTGVPASEVLGKNALEIFPHLREQGIDRLLEQALAGEIVCSPDTPYHVPQTGKSGWVVGTYAPHRDAEGRIIGVVATIHDITERKRVEDALQKSEQYARSIIDSSLDMIVTTDPERRIVEFNQAAQKTFGYTRDEVIGQHIDLLYADPVAGHDVHRVTFELGKSAQDVLNKRKNGEVFVSRVSAATMRDARGALLGIVGVSRDITEQKRTEEALAREQYLLNTLMDNFPDHVYFKDAQSRFIRISRALAQAFGLSDPAEAVGKTDFDFFTEEHARRAYEDEQRIIRTGQPIVGLIEKETWSEHPDTWVSTTKMALCDVKGDIIGTFGVSRDITERKRAEEELAQEHNLLRSLIDNVPDYIYVKDTQGRFLTANPAVARLMGAATSDELLGKTDFDFFPQELAAKYYADEQAIFQSQ